MKKRHWLFLLLITIFFASLAFAETAQNIRSIKIWDDEPAGTHVFFLSDLEMAITEIDFSTSEGITSGRMIIEKLSSLPPSIPTVSYSYQYFTIGKFGLNEEPKAIVVKFRVEKPIASEYEITAFEYDGEWKNVSTQNYANDSTYHYYTAYPKTLSYFAIAAKEKPALQVPIETIPENAESNTQTETQNSAEETAQLPQNFVARMFVDNKKMFIYGGGVALLLIILIFIGFLMDLFLKGDYFENLAQAREFIDEELAEGVPKKQIEQELLSQGWPKRVVEKIVHMEHVPPEMEVMIKSYVQSMKNKRVPEDRIKSSLVSQGWADETIDELMSQLTSS